MLTLFSQACEIKLLVCGCLGSHRRGQITATLRHFRRQQRGQRRTLAHALSELGRNGSHATREGRVHRSRCVVVGRNDTVGDHYVVEADHFHRFDLQCGPLRRCRLKLTGSWRTGGGRCARCGWLNCQRCMRLQRIEPKPDRGDQSQRDQAESQETCACASKFFERCGHDQAE